MANIRDYKDLNVWQRSMDLAVEIYKLVKLLPREETYALSDQMRRAVVSISSNIAEGQQRGTDKAYVHFLQIARGSNAELESQLLLGIRLGYFTREQADVALNLISETGKMLNNFIKNCLTVTDRRPLTADC